MWQVAGGHICFTSTHHLLEHKSQFSTHLLPNCYNWYCGNKSSSVDYSLWNNFIPALYFLFVCLFFHLLTFIHYYSLLILVSGRSPSCGKPKWYLGCHCPVNHRLSDSDSLSTLSMYESSQHIEQSHMIHIPVVPAYSCLFQKGVIVSTLLSAWARS